MSLPEIVSKEQWLQAREALLAREKEHTRARDALSAERRRLPMVEIDAPYVFHGPEGDVGLADLFDGCSQLIVGHFMFDPEWEDGCPSCSAGADEVADGLREHLRARDTNLVYVSLAPLDKLERWKALKGWTFPWYSSHGSTFNRDFGVTRDDGEHPGTSVFLRVGERVFHTYSSYDRGAEWTGGSYAWLDLTALGRQEPWEEPQGRADALHSATPDFAS